MIISTKMREARQEEIGIMCRRLILSKQIVDRCKEATPKQEEFIYEVLLNELEQRAMTRKTRLLNRAKFPVLKSLTGYKFDKIRFPPSLTREALETCDFIREKTNIICYGEVGTGKTHLATAIGVKACEMDIKVRFYTVTELVLKLADSRNNGTLERLITDLKRMDLLILDEWGYVPVDKEGSQLLFRVIADSYESKSLILTTNLEFSKWGGIFTDQQMAAAMIDRLVHHGHLLFFDGPSHRMEHALMRKIGPSSEVKEEPVNDC